MYHRRCSRKRPKSETDEKIQLRKVFFLLFWGATHKELGANGASITISIRFYVKHTRRDSHEKQWANSFEFLFYLCASFSLCSALIPLSWFLILWLCRCNSTIQFSRWGLFHCLLDCVAFNDILLLHIPPKNFHLSSRWCFALPHHKIWFVSN